MRMAKQRKRMTKKVMRMLESQNKSKVTTYHGHEPHGPDEWEKKGKGSRWATDDRSHKRSHF